MDLLGEGGWIEALRDYLQRSGVHLLGICLGAQLLGERSDEGLIDGLGFLDFETIRFPESIGLPVPTCAGTRSQKLKIPRIGLQCRSSLVSTLPILFSSSRGAQRHIFLRITAFRFRALSELGTSWRFNFTLRSLIDLVKRH